MFILNLAASDVMMCLLSLPITPVTNIYKNWYFGNALCHLIPCVQGKKFAYLTTFLAIRLAKNQVHKKDYVVVKRKGQHAPNSLLRAKEELPQILP